MYWLRILLVLAVSSLLIFLIIKKVKNKEIAIFLITYIIATLIRGFAGFSFNIFHDKFDLIRFIIDIMIWALSYLGVRLFITKLTKHNSIEG